MSPTPILLIAAGFLVAADAVQKPGKPAVQPRVARPIRVKPIIRNQFQFRVQKSSRFPKQARPAVSKPVTNRGLQVTVQPEKKEFAGNGPLAFEVVLTNRSQKGLMLYSPNGLGKSPQLVISNLNNANQWTISSTLKLGGSSTPLAPGKSLTLTAVVETRFVRPVPFPQPIPRPNVRRGKGAAQIRIGRPIRPPIIAVPAMPCGQGKCRARLLLEFAENPQKKRYPFPHWTGKIASGPIDFTVGKPRPIVVPGGPASKDQAIRLAHPVAERALQGHYKPLANVRPPRVGPWIESPEKTAAVKKSATGGWSVSWTSFPAKGHGYNITVEVSNRGGAVVREVFTSYSKR